MSKRLGAVIAAGVALRLGLLGWYLSTHGGRPETWEPEALVQNLLAGRGYVWDGMGLEYRSSIMPLFPLACWALHRLGGEGFALYYLFQAGLSAGIILLTYRLGTAVFGARAGLLAAALAAVDPGMIVYQSYKVDVNALSTFLILASSCLFLEWLARGGAAWAAGSGVAAGLAVLTRPDLICLAALPAGALGRGKGAFKTVALFLGAGLLVVSPWLIRNHRLHGRWILQGTAELFWRGNNPNATGTTLAPGGAGQWTAAPPDLRERVLRAGEMEREDIFREAALTHIRSDPAAFLRRALRNAAAFWWFTPSFGGAYYEWVGPTPKTLFRLYYALLAASALAGLGMATRRPLPGPSGGLAGLLAVAGALTLIHAATYVEGRHRLLVLPFLLAASAHAAVSIWYNPRGHD